MIRNRKNGYVALFDVLGFSDRVFRNGTDGLDSYIDPVVEIAGTLSELGLILFSDTVVLFTSDDTDGAFDAIIKASSQLLHAFIFRGVPVRGAIAHGEFVRSDHSQHGTVIAGRPIIEAHHYEVQLQAVGVMLAPSVIERMEQLSKRPLLKSAKGKPLPARLAIVQKALEIQPWNTIPLEPTFGTITPYDGFAIVPTARATIGTVDEITNDFKSLRKKLQRLKQLAPESRSQAKYQRTIDWLVDVSRRVDNAQLSRATASDFRNRTIGR